MIDPQVRCACQELYAPVMRGLIEFCHRTWYAAYRKIRTSAR